MNAMSKAQDYEGKVGVLIDLNVWTECKDYEVAAIKLNRNSLIEQNAQNNYRQSLLREISYHGKIFIIF